MFEPRCIFFEKQRKHFFSLELRGKALEWDGFSGLPLARPRGSSSVWRERAIIMQPLARVNIESSSLAGVSCLPTRCVLLIAPVWKNASIIDFSYTFSRLSFFVNYSGELYEEDGNASLRAKIRWGNVICHAWEIVLIFEESGKINSQPTPTQTLPNIPTRNVTANEKLYFTFFLVIKQKDSCAKFLPRINTTFCGAFFLKFMRPNFCWTFSPKSTLSAKVYKI